MRLRLEARLELIEQLAARARVARLFVRCIYTHERYEKFPEVCHDIVGEGG